MTTFWRSDFEMAARDGVIAYAFYVKLLSKSKRQRTLVVQFFLS